MNHKDYIKAMTPGRWPPKPVDEMTMSPGTERAIMKVADSLPHLLPRLLYSLENLSYKLETAIKAMEKKELKTESDEIVLTLALTSEEWCEVANAVSIRAVHLRHGESPDKDMDAEDVEAWAKQLDSAYNKIAALLNQNHITY